MPNDLSPGDFHHDTLISNLLVGYRPRGMIADRVFPVIPVAKESNTYPRIDRGNWFRLPTTQRAPGTAPHEVRYTVSSDTYRTVNYELSTVVDWETIDNADAPFEPLVRGGEFLVDQLMLDFENRTATRAWATVGSSSTLTGASAWDNFLNSDPLTDLEVAREAVRATTGFVPNQAIVPEKTWLKVRRHPDIVRAVFPGAGVGGIVSTAQFADLIGVGEVIVPGTIKNTGGAGLADAFVDVWSTSTLLLYTDPRPGIMRPSFGAAFRWGGPNIGMGGPGAFAIERRRDTKRKVEELQTGYYQDEKTIAPELGFLIATGIT